MPTFTESGVPFICAAWVGLTVPALTPKVTKLAADVSRVISTREFQDRYIAGLAVELLNQGPDEFSAFLKAERAKYKAFVRRDVDVRQD